MLPPWPRRRWHAAQAIAKTSLPAFASPLFSAINAATAVSLGLLVTELVINSLKHAFPDGRKGRIDVSYNAHGPNWTLAVADDGVGMPGDSESQTPGLGTSIVEALANQLKARVQVVGGHPGTTVSVIHTQISAVAADAKAGRAV